MGVQEVLKCNVHMLEQEVPHSLFIVLMGVNGGPQIHILYECI